MKYLTDDILKHKSYLDDNNIKPNQIYYFIDTDSESAWKTQIKKNKNNPSIHYYTKNPVEYKLNNEGFRTPNDFNSVDFGNVYLGCSHTFGIGHHLENIWSYKLNKIIGDKFWNLGIGGTGVTTHFRLLLGYYKKLKIKNIFHYAPMYPRFEFIENKKPHNYIICNYNKKWVSKFGELMETSLLTDEQNEFNWITYTRAIQSLANEIGCNYYLIQGSYGTHCRDKSLQARDLSHYTTLYHHKIYQDFLKMYNKNLFEKYKDKQKPILDIEKYLKNEKLNII